MLKKLSKYGNSTTLVIDKAILELLNMNESSIVKLQTDGKSLTITPVESKDDQKLSYENFEALNIAKEAKVKKMISIGSDKTLDASKIQEEFSKVFQKHQQAFAKFNHEIFPSNDFQEALALLTEKLDPVEQNAEYLKEFNKLKLQFCPELENMQNEIDDIYKKSS